MCALCALVLLLFFLSTDPLLFFPKRFGLSSMFRRLLTWEVEVVVVPAVVLLESAQWRTTTLSQQMQQRLWPLLSHRWRGIAAAAEAKEEEMQAPLLLPPPLAAVSK
jgi:hypothetical protein